MRYKVTLADTADHTGESTSEHVIEVADDDTPTDAAVDFSIAQGKTDDKWYMVVGIERGDD